MRTQLAANVSLVLSDLQAGVILNSTATQLIAEAQQDADDAAALVAVQAAQCGGAPAGSTLCAAFAARQQAAVAAATADVRSSLAALDATGYRAGAASMIAGVSALSVRINNIQHPNLTAPGTQAHTQPSFPPLNPPSSPYPCLTLPGVHSRAGRPDIRGYGHGPDGPLFCGAVRHLRGNDHQGAAAERRAPAAAGCVGSVCAVPTARAHFAQARPVET